MENNIIIDVRTPEEFAEGHISQAVNIPLDELENSIDGLRQYEVIVLVCRSGVRTLLAKELLETNGFENVTDGGGWEKYQELNDSFI